MGWLIAAGLHPRANATTQQIADDLATRMDYDTGHARYLLDETVARTGISRASVKRHIGYLRELGALAWVQHGSRINIRRVMGLKGYAATATVYAAVIPPVFDHAMGHRIVGSGYRARIIVDLRNQAKPVDSPPVDNSGPEGLEPPSLYLVEKEGKVQMGGGNTSSTAKTRTARPGPRRKKRKLTILGYKITGERIDEARRLAVRIRPLVNWIQGASHNELSWVLLDLVAKGWTEPKILLWLRSVGQEIGAQRWRPSFPHRVIAAALQRLDRAETERAITVGPDDEPLRHVTGPNQEFAQAAEQTGRYRKAEPTAEYPTVDQVAEDAWDRIALQEAAESDASLVLSFAAVAGRDEAVRVYGARAADIIDCAAEQARTGIRVLVS